MKKSKSKSNSHPKKPSSLSRNPGNPGATRKTFYFLVAVFFVPVLVYLHTLKFRYTSLDDNLIISSNVTFLSNIKNAPQVFFTDAFLNKTSSFYRPLQTLSFMIDNQVSGGNITWTYHFSNIILFGLIACLLFLLLKRLHIPPNIAALFTLIYCVHPLFISCVSWLPARGDMLLAFFTLLTILLLQEYLKKGKFLFLFLHWITFTLALYCKETAAFLPFLFILYYFSFSETKKIEKKYILNILLYGFSGIIWFWMRSKALADYTNTGNLVEYGFPALLKNIRIIPESLTCFFIPYSIHVLPTFSYSKLIIGSVLILLFLFLLFHKSDRTQNEKLFCIGWFLSLLVPTFFFRGLFVDYLNHRFFLPFIGILMFVLFVLPKDWIQNKANVIVISLAIIIVSFSFLIHFSSKAYSDPIAFYSTVIEENPKSAFGFNSRGVERLNAHDYAEARNDFEHAIKIDSTISDSYLYKGIAEIFTNDITDAERSLNKSIMLSPNRDIAYYYRGMTKAISGDIPEAINNYNKAIQINPEYLEAYRKKVIAKFVLKDFKGVVEDCEDLLKRFPNDETALEYKGKAELELQKN